MAVNSLQALLFPVDLWSLPSGYSPVCLDHFVPSRIFMAKGSRTTSGRSVFVDGIRRLYPKADVINYPDIPHNRIDLQAGDSLSLYKKGKLTLVFGKLQNAVRFSAEEQNTCPNYWHFSPYGFCPFGCKYCYLAGTQGVKFSPTGKIYVKMPEMLDEVDRIASGLGVSTAFYLGKL